MSQGMAGGIGRTSHGMSMMSNPGMMPGMQGIQMQPNMTMRSMQHAAMVGPMNQQVSSPRMLNDDDKKPIIISQSTNSCMVGPTNQQMSTPRMLCDKEPEIISQKNNMSMTPGVMNQHAPMRPMQHAAIVGPMNQQVSPPRMLSDEEPKVVSHNNNISMVGPMNQQGGAPRMLFDPKLNAYQKDWIAYQNYVTSMGLDSPKTTKEPKTKEPIPNKFLFLDNNFEIPINKTSRSPGIPINKVIWDPAFPSNYAIIPINDADRSPGIPINNADRSTGIPINDAGMRPAMPNNAQQDALADLDLFKMIENVMKTTSTEDLVKIYKTSKRILYDKEPKEVSQNNNTSMEPGSPKTTKKPRTEEPIPNKFLFLNNNAGRSPGIPINDASKSSGIPINNALPLPSFETTFLESPGYLRIWSH